MPSPSQKSSKSPSPSGRSDQRGAHQPLRIVHDLRHVADELVGAVAAGQRLQPFGRAQRGGELGAEVALALIGRADVGENHLLEVGVERAAADQPQRRQAQPLAIDLGHRAVAAGRGGADVRPVRAQAGVAEQPPLVERRRTTFTSGRWLPPK